MTNYNLRQTGAEVQTLIDAIPVIDVTGTQYGSRIVISTNPYSQIASNYTAGCGPVVRLTVGSKAYIVVITEYDGTSYKGCAKSGDVYVDITCSSSEASAVVSPVRSTQIIEVTAESASDTMFNLTPNPRQAIYDAIESGQYVVIRTKVEDENIDIPISAYIAQLDMYVGSVKVLSAQAELACTSTVAQITFSR